MNAWFRKHKWKALASALIASVLAAAFYFGGSAPGLQGWSVNNSAQTQAESAASSERQASSGASPSAASSAGSPAAAAFASARTGTAANTKKEAAAQAVDAKKAGSDIASRPGGTEGNMSASDKMAAAQEIAGQTGSSAGVEKGDKSYSEQQGMQIDTKTDQDKYQTDPVPEGKPIPVEPQDAVITDKECTCTLSISCDTINDNLSWLDPEKVELVPEDGWILKPTQVTFYEGESVFNVLLRTCKQRGIHMEYENTPIYNSACIEGIHNLYEFDCGELSGWMYKVNDWFPNYGCSRYQLRDGDTVDVVYTCDLGYDVGGGYSAGA